MKRPGEQLGNQLPCKYAHARAWMDLPHLNISDCVEQSTNRQAIGILSSQRTAHYAATMILHLEVWILTPTCA